MKAKIIIASIVVSTIISCSSSGQSCKCNQYFTSSNGNTVLYGEANMELCDGTIANPSLQITAYQKKCN